MREILRSPLLGICAALVFANNVGGVGAQPNAIDGREIFLNARNGNCAACHALPGEAKPQDKLRMGPDLAGIKERFPDRTILRAAIWDLSETVPNTVMPPYGKHRILTEVEIDAVVRYLEAR